MNRKLVTLLGLLALGLAHGQDAPSLRSLAEARDFQIGAAVDVGALFDSTEPEYATTLAGEFNLLTPENAMKWTGLRPARGQYSFSAADALVKFALDHGMRVRGHTLVWHQQMPTWLIAGNFSGDVLRAILENHIRNVVTHYRDSLEIWDVVNEAVSDSVVDGKAPMRDSLWSRGLGKGYIEWAFRQAHAANGTAKLFYNDYNAETMNPKSQTIYEMVRDFKAHKVPIDGVGMQMHIGIRTPPDLDSLRANIQRLNDLGLEVQITELDVKLDDGRPKAQQLEAQAQIYSDILKVCLETNCTAFVMWGFTDAHSWLTSSKPLIFDSDYSKKPAYKALAAVLQTR